MASLEKQLQAEKEELASIDIPSSIHTPKENFVETKFPFGVLLEIEKTILGKRLHRHYTGSCCRTHFKAKKEEQTKP